MDDDSDEPDETVAIAFSNPTGGAALGQPSTASLTILDDDAPAGGGGGGGGAAPCVPGANTLCLDDQPGDRRFQVQIAYHTQQSGGFAGVGKALDLDCMGVNQGGLFWFFARGNPEVMVKVLNGCGVNQKYCVFLTAGTNVGFEATVTDTQTGRIRVYTNEDLKAAMPIQDTSALPCTP